MGPSRESGTATEEESRHSAPSLGAQATTFLSDASQPEVDFPFPFPFPFLGNVIAKLFRQIVCISVRKHGKTNVVPSSHIKR